MHSWFCHNGLDLNSTKSESILIGTRQRLRTLPPIASPKIAGTPITFSDTIKTLGVTLDQNLTLNKHVSLLSRNIHVYTRALRHISPKFSHSCGTPSLRHLSASELLSYLYWLPVNYRIQFKIATLTYKTLATCQPSYLYNLLQVYHPSRALRS